MQRQLLSLRSLVYERANPHKVSDYVNQHVGNHCIFMPKDNKSLACLAHRKFSTLDLCRISYGDKVQVISPALESIYHLQVLMEGHCLWTNRGHQHIFVPGEVLLINPNEPVDIRYSADCEKLIIKIPAALLQAVCDAHRWLSPDSGVLFLRNRYQLNELEGFVNLLVMVCQEAEAVDQQPWVQERYAQILASKMLGLMPNNVKRVDAVASSASFDLIAHYIEQHLKHDISSQELAQLTRMSERSLYNLFERYVRTTPQQYIRQKKLERIHAYLSNPECAVHNLTALALDFGFMHLGRFSEQYRKQFGELPSQTLKRR